MKKLIPLALIAFLLAGAFYYLYSKQFQKTNQNTPQPTSASPTSTATDTADKAIVSTITDNFYKDYDSCMKNPPSQAAGKVSAYCQNNTGLTTTTFKANLEKGGTAKAGADPIFCAQNIPESVNINPDTQITGGKAIVFVSEKFGPTQIKIQVDILKENDAWKIDNIICPLP